MSKHFTGTSRSYTTLLLLLLTTYRAVAADIAPQELLGRSGVTGGVAVLLGCGDGTFAAGLHTGDRLLVHALGTDAAAVAKAKAHIDLLGIYGHVSAEAYDGKNLPYGDSIVNLIVVADSADVAFIEIERVLTPNGVAMVKSGVPLAGPSGLRKGAEADGWITYAKPWPDNMDQWTHFLYDASNNAVSKDERVGSPRRLQWFAGPEHTRHHDALASMSAMTSSGGRVFYIYDEGPVSLIHRPADWKLVARDAFNGKLLWKRDIATWMTHLYNFRAGPVQLTRRLVSVGDSVYATLGFAAPVQKLDAATGETVLTYTGSDRAEELVWHDGMLLVVTGDPEMLIDKSDDCHGYWELTENEEATVDKAICAYDGGSGSLLWRRDEGNLKTLAPLSLCARGDAVFYLDGKQLHCLDKKNGDERWAAPFETEGLFIRSYTPTVVVSDDVIMVLTWNRLHGFSVTTGEMLWKKKGAMGFGSPADLFVMGGKAWTAPMRKSIWRESRTNKDGVITTGIPIPQSDFLNNAETAVSIDIHTGQIADMLPFVHNQHHHRCYRNKATERFLLIGHSGIQLVDPVTQAGETNQWVRGLCQYGIMPANGCIYVPPDPCRCYSTIKINGFFALCERNSLDAIEQKPALETGPAYERMSAQPAPASPDNADEWPTYRGDAARSGFAATGVGETLRKQWEADIGGTVTAPVMAGGRVFVASRDAYTVHSLDAANGRPAWRYLANGPVDSPPTIASGLCVFGSGDGSVTCLDAVTGELAWRFKTLGLERRVGSENRLESPLRVHGSVLVQKGVVYFTAGRSSNLDGGIRIYGLDLRTGKELYSTTVSSKRSTKVGALADILVSDGNTIGMRQLRFSHELENGAKGSVLVASAGFLDGSWFDRQGWSMRGAKGQLIVYGNGMSYSIVNPYSGLKQRRKGKFAEFNQVGHFHQKFTRYKEEHFPLGCTIVAKGPDWTVDELFQPRAMVLAGDRLCVGGWLDSMPIELKSGRPKSAAGDDDPVSVLRVYNADTGTRLSEYPLAASPVFDGMASAYGRLFVSLQNGQLLCLAGKRAD